MPSAVGALLLSGLATCLGCGVESVAPPPRVGPPFLTIHRVVDRGTPASREVPTFVGGEPLIVMIEADLTDHDVVSAAVGSHAMGTCVRATISAEARERLERSLRVGPVGDREFPRIAFVLDGKAISSPVVREGVPRVLDILRGGRRNGFTAEEAHALARRLTSPGNQ